LFPDEEAGNAFGRVEPAPQAFRQALETASSYTELMMQLRVTRGDVVRWLEADATARQTWRKRLQDNRVDTAEKTLTHAIRGSPLPSRVDINKVASKEVRLLRRHAPDRLAALLQAIPSEGDPQKPLWLHLPLL
jgi:hypothetical protein